MIDALYLTEQGRQLHEIFYQLFYAIVLTLLLIGVAVEYFKLPLGGVPSFGVLVGRALIASLLLASFPTILSAIGDVTDALAQRLGDLNKINLVEAKMAEKLKTMTASWVSVKETITMGISYVSFLLLYFSVFVAQGFFLFTWTLLYVLSPVLIALFVLPATAPATSALFRSLIEVSLWKVLWACLATLLWSMALTQLNREQANVPFVTVLCYNVILAGSLLLTPWVVHSLAGAGLANYTKSLGNVAVGALTLSPGHIYRGLKKSGKGVYHHTRSNIRNFQNRRERENSPGKSKGKSVS